MDHFYKNIPGWSHESTQGELLKYMLSHYPTDYFLKIGELGVYLGRCTALWNVELINSKRKYEYHGLDSFKGSVEHINLNIVPDLEQAQINLNPVLDKINLIEGDSLDVVSNFDDEYFDIVYIDMSHDYESVKKDIQAWQPKVKKGGFLSGDDYHVTWPGVMKAVTEVFGGNRRIIGGTQWVTQIL